MAGIARFRGKAGAAGALVLIVALLVGLPALEARESPSKLVGVEWLAANLKNPGVRIIDLRAEIRDYWESHIPGSVFLDTAALRWPERGVPGKLMPPPVLARLLGEMGIGRDTRIVIYSEVHHYRAAYFAWALDYIGHESWAVLENGFEGWKGNSLPLTQDYPPIKPVSYAWDGAVDPSVRATLEEVKTRDTGGTVLIDVRPKDLYSGKTGAWKRRGHIPGAINHFWTDDVDAGGKWKSPEILRAAYAEQGVTPDKMIIVSCGQGQMSSHAYFTLKYILGFPRVKNYDGSFNEWSNRDDLPVETSPDR
jgi:thiosulfate/3-mercaptopyruvate sulfurtransferase